MKYTMKLRCFLLFSYRNNSGNAIIRFLRYLLQGIITLYQVVNFKLKMYKNPLRMLKSKLNYTKVFK